jgi:patatin-related protein
VTPPVAEAPVIGDIREVRFAVVLYGGLSLAIYMNGVAQELLRMVRATAPAGLDGQGRDHAIPLAELTGSERTYRKLGQLGEGTSAPPDQVPEDAPILRRFVIDILSGSSAGGINGVFLAKALANHQSIEALERLWVEEGDIAKLLNDRGSLEGLRQRVSPKGTPQALLNGRRMYRKLLEAFDGMDGDDEAKRSAPTTTSPYADQLDLYVTTTDVQGLRMPLRITNGVVVELRHRNVFHFAYATESVGGEQVNDFHAANNPFLAFAARCTSAFPMAFEPMSLSAIDDDLADFPRYPPADRGAASPDWKRFYRDYLGAPRDLVGSVEAAPAGGLPFARRQFGDGGSLDNKPFTWATNELLRRRADNPVDRKLVYVEPDPHPAEDSVAVLNPLENAVAQGLMLPREETIRSDLEAVIARNEVIRRLEQVLLSVEMLLLPPDTRDPAQFTSRTLEDEITERGPNYGAYRTLRVETLMDDLARLVASAIGYPDAPGYMRALRYLVQVWRRERFPDLHTEPGQRPTTLTYFLWAFDVQYRLRRLELVKRKIDHVYPLRAAGDEAGMILQAAGIDFWPAVGSAEEVAFQHELLRLKRLANEIDHRWFRRLLSDLSSKGKGPEPGPIQARVAAIGLDEPSLRSILEGADEDARLTRAGALFYQHRDAFMALGDWLEETFLSARSAATEYWRTLLDPPGGEASPPEKAARDLVRQSYDRFEAYDSVAFPMLYGAEVGEADEVEIVRISPIDAKRLRDVSSPGVPPKVAGARLGHFGGFLDERWRKNDILWGRLDAAELLVETLVPTGQDPAAREALVQSLRREAQAAILREHFTGEQQALLVRRVMGGEVGGRGGLVELDPAVRSFVDALVADDHRLLKTFADEYRVDTRLPPGPTMRTAGRGLHVAGAVVRGAADQRGLAALKKPFFWVGRIGQLITGLSEAALPGSWTHILTAHVLGLLYLFEVGSFAVGLVFGQRTLQRWALSALLVTLAVNVALWILRAFLTERRWWRTAVALLLAALLAATVVLAVQRLQDLGRRHPDLPFFGRNPAPSASPSPGSAP